jgi:hypothetical protein
LPGDAMHDILEGILQYESKQFKKHAVMESKYLTLHELDQSILKMDYGYYNDKNRPSIISSRTSNAQNNTLKQSGNQLLLIVLI